MSDAARDIAATIIPLEPQGAPGKISPRDAQGLLFNLLARADPSLARQAHDEAQPKTYGLSLGPGWLRVTLTDPRLCAAATPILRAAAGELVRLGGSAYRLGPATVDDHAWAGLTTHARLLQAASPNEPEVTLELVTPTTFRRGKLNVPLPEPRLVFGGLAAKWNAGSPIPVDAGFGPWLEEHVGVARLDVRTSLADGVHSPLVGFTGRVTFRAFDRQPVRVKQLGALARFAFYAGVGHKTTLGLGRARLLDPRRAHDPQRARPASNDSVPHPAWQTT